AGATVATFYSNTRDVLAQISEEKFAKVQVGQPAEVTLVIYPNQKFNAKVSKILPNADDSQRYTIYLSVEADAEVLKPYATGEVRITVGEHDNQPLVPRTAIFNNKFVSVVKNGRVERREVDLGFTGLNVAEVTKGLAPGELVIVDAPDE